MKEVLERLIKESLENWSKLDGAFLDVEIVALIDQLEEVSIIPLAYEVMKTLEFNPEVTDFNNGLLTGRPYDSWVALCYDIIWFAVKAEIYTRNPEIIKEDLRRLNYAKKQLSTIYHN